MNTAIGRVTRSHPLAIEVTETTWVEWDKATRQLDHMKAASPIVIKPKFISIKVLARSLIKHLRMKDQVFAELVAERCIEDLMSAP